MRSALIFTAVFVAMAPAQAQCDHTMAERLQFLLPLAASDFAAIRGPSTGDGQYGSQYGFSGEGTRWCPNAMILEKTLAHDGYPEFFEVKFDASMAGTGDDVTMTLFKSFSPVLKAAGFPEKPIVNNGDEEGTYRLEWDGPSNTWVTLHTFLESDRPGRVGYEIKVGHDHR